MGLCLNPDACATQVSSSLLFLGFKFLSDREDNIYTIRKDGRIKCNNKSKVSGP